MVFAGAWRAGTTRREAEHPPSVAGTGGAIYAARAAVRIVAAERGMSAVRISRVAPRPADPAVGRRYRGGATRCARNRRRGPPGALNWPSRWPESSGAAHGPRVISAASELKQSRCPPHSPACSPCAHGAAPAKCGMSPVRTSHVALRARTRPSGGQVASFTGGEVGPAGRPCVPAMVGLDWHVELRSNRGRCCRC